MSSAKLSKFIMIRKITTLLLSCSLVFGSVSFSFASSVQPSNFVPYLQSNQGFIWTNPNGSTSTVTSGTKLTDMIGRLGGSVSQGIYSLLSALESSSRVFLYNYNGTSISVNSGTGFADILGSGFSYLSQTSSYIYDKVDDILTDVGSIKGYVDGVETGLTSVNTNLSNIKSDTNSIKGYIDGLEAGQSNIVNAINGIDSTDLSNVESWLTSIASDVEATEQNTRFSESGIDSLYDFLDNEFNENVAGTAMQTWQAQTSHLGNIYADLGYSGLVTRSVADDFENVVNVGSDIVSSVDNVHDVNSTISAISGDILAINTTMSAIQTSIAGINEGIHSDTTLLNSKLAQFNNDFNNISWSPFNVSIEGYYKNLSQSKITNQTSSNEWFIKLNSFLVSNSIFKIQIPMFVGGTLDSIYRAELGYSNNGVFYKINDALLTFDELSQVTNIYIFTPEKFYQTSSNYCIHIIGDTNQIYINPNGVVYSSTISNDKQDFYTFFSYIFERNIIDLIREAKEMFFDDETLQAKKDNASQTSAVIDGFTSDGDASASASDFGIVKDSVSSVKSGVNTNVSASEALNIFNSSDGFGFWSTDCLNALDTTNSNRLLRSRSGSDTPLYDEKLQALYNAMGVNND